MTKWIKGVILSFCRPLQRGSSAQLGLLRMRAMNSPQNSQPLTKPLSEEQAQIALVAAQRLIDSGLELGVARSAAVAQLRLPARSGLPPLAAVLAEARTQLRLYHPDQAQISRGLRQLALRWMQRLGDFAPCIRGNVWLGLGGRFSSIYLDVYADSPKDVEIFLINQGQAYETPDSGEREDAPLLRCMDVVDGLPQAGMMAVAIYVQTHDASLRRGALKPGIEPGSSLRLRGDTAALEALLQEAGD